MINTTSKCGGTLNRFVHINNDALYKPDELWRQSDIQVTEIPHFILRNNIKILDGSIEKTAVSDNRNHQVINIRAIERKAVFLLLETLLVI